MIAWLVIAGEPTRQFCRNALALPYLSTAHSRDQIMLAAGTLRASVDGEAGNMSIALDNRAGRCTQLFALPPLGAAATVRGVVDGVATDLFAGVVRATPLDAAGCSIEIVAGDHTPMTAPLPLRTTAAWQGYREARPIPHRYGSVGGELLQYDDTRAVFVWADHASAAIDEVLVADVASTGWTWRNGVDSTGAAVTFVEFAEPVDEGATVVARGRGKLHPRTGVLMTNPAEIVWDVLCNIAGNDVAESALDAFRAECARAGLIAAGEIAEPLTLQATVRQIAASVGAIYSTDAHGLCRLWPGGDATASRETIDHRYTLSAAPTLDDIVTAIELRYAFEAGEPRAVLELDAPDQVAHYGRRPAAVDLPWIGDARTAHAVGSRILQQRARPQWVVTAADVPVRIRVGDAVTLSHDVSPVSGAHVVLAREADLDADRGTITVRAPAGDAPTIRLVRVRERGAVQPYASAPVQTVGDSRVLTLTETDGTPIAQAQVTLRAAGVVRLSDAAGRVDFPVALMPRGRHWLDIVAQDGRTLSVQVLVG